VDHGSVYNHTLATILVEYASAVSSRNIYLNSLAGKWIKKFMHKQFLVPPFYHVKQYNLLVVTCRWHAVALTCRRGQHFRECFKSV
jgi:hypothetical protein